MTLNDKSTISPGTAFYKRDQDFLKLLERTLRQNYSKRSCNLQIMSEKTGKSKRQIQRKIKKLLGSTSSEYLRSYRLKKSLLLLHQGLTVREVAQAVGFSSQSYYATCFKTQFGYTPTEYQRQQIRSTSDMT